MGRLGQVVSDGGFIVWRGLERVCPGPRIRGPGQTRGQTAPVMACGDRLQYRSLVVNNDGFFIFQHGKNFGAEDLFQCLGLALGQAMEGAIGSEQAVGDNGMEVWMKPGVVTGRCGSP
jgi:hypothetical protein